MSNIQYKDLLEVVQPSNAKLPCLTCYNPRE